VLGIARFLGALLAVFVIHLLGVTFVPYFSSAVDLFVVWIVLEASRGDEVRGMLAGVCSGLAEDALSGALYGLHGFAGTVVGFAVARTSRRLASQDPGVLGLVALGAQPLHELVAILLESLLVAEGGQPLLGWIAVRTLTTALLALAALVVAERFERRWDDWQKTRTRRVSLGDGRR
jgi:rod shape-determining protein MreD